jgi:hypothetical protein
MHGSRTWQYQTCARECTADVTGRNLLTASGVSSRCLGVPAGMAPGSSSRSSSIFSDRLRRYGYHLDAKSPKKKRALR